MKSQGCLLTYWLPMTNILFKIPRIFNSQFKCNYLKNEKLFLNLLFHLSSLPQILNILKERILVIANVFVSLQTVKNLVRTLSKQRCFRTRFNSQHVKVSQILAISPWRRFYHVFSSFSLKLTRKMLPLAFGEILWASVNTVTTDGKCFVQHCENLLFPIQMQLSEK